MNSKTLLLTCLLCSPLAIVSGCDSPDSTVDQASQAADNATNAAQSAADTVQNAADSTEKTE